MRKIFFGPINYTDKYGDLYCFKDAKKLPLMIIASYNTYLSLDTKYNVINCVFSPDCIFSSESLEDSIMFAMNRLKELGYIYVKNIELLL